MKLIAIVVVTAAEHGTTCRKVFCGKPFVEGDEAVLLVDDRGGLTVHCTHHNELPQEVTR